MGTTPRIPNSTVTNDGSSDPQPRDGVVRHVPHGLMFHHFHGEHFSPSQGSIGAGTFGQILAHYLETRQVLDAGTYLRRARHGQLESDDVCITFDDSLLCQYEIARPVLERAGITAFWFVYSSVITGGIETLEIYRRFRSEWFDDIGGFYGAFFEAVAESPHAVTVATALRTFEPSTYLAEFTFYSDDDRRFRYVRDLVLGQKAYDEVMSIMMTIAGTSPAQLAKGLWIDSAQLRRLHHDGHVIGLHSHTHPTTLADLPIEQQRREYLENWRILNDILGMPPTTMSHPCNSYDAATLAMLESLGIELGFRSNMAPWTGSKLEHPREDHANIVAALGLSDTHPQAAERPKHAERQRLAGRRGS